MKAVAPAIAIKRNDEKYNETINFLGNVAAGSITKTLSNLIKNVIKIRWNR
jgi:hypothetical protein